MKISVRLCYYNEHWNVYIHTPDGKALSVGKTDRHVKDSHGTFRLTEWNHQIPFFTFGYLTNNPKKRPDHGGEWSSNVGAINKVFGVNLISVAVDSISAAVPLAWIQKILGNQVIWRDIPIYGTSIVHVKGHPPKNMEWALLDLIEIHDNQGSQAT